METNNTPATPENTEVRIINKPATTALNLLRVATKSNPSSVAGAIAGLVRDNGRAELQAIGAGAINQAVKAIGIARGYVAPAGIDLVAIPAFSDVNINGEDRTAMKFIVEAR